MRVTCPCGRRFDISNREVLAMADKLRAKKAGEANVNLRTDPPPLDLQTTKAHGFMVEPDGNKRPGGLAQDVQSIALRFWAENKGGGRGEPTEDDL